MATSADTAASGSSARPDLLDASSIQRAGNVNCSGRVESALGRRLILETPSGAEADEASGLLVPGLERGRPQPVGEGQRGVVVKRRDLVALDARCSCARLCPGCSKHGPRPQRSGPTGRTPYSSLPSLLARGSAPLL
jgi:hypothetical protein